MKNSIAWHDTFPEKYRVTKVVLQHVSDWKITKKLKKVFVKVSAIIMVFFVIICVICGLNCPIHPWGARALEFSVFFRSVFVPKNFGFWDSVLLFVEVCEFFYSLTLKIWLLFNSPSSCCIIAYSSVIRTFLLVQENILYLRSLGFLITCLFDNVRILLGEVTC